MAIQSRYTKYASSAVKKLRYLSMLLGFEALGVEAKKTMISTIVTTANADAASQIALLSSFFVQRAMVVCFLLSQRWLGWEKGEGS